MAEYLVTFDKTGGTGGTSYTWATYGDSMPSAQAPKKSGYDFNGYWDSDGTQYYNSTMESWHLYDVHGQMTLYAAWVPKQHTLTLNKNGGSGGDSTATATYGLDVPVLSSAPTRTGYTFAGYWAEAEDDSATNYLYYSETLIPKRRYLVDGNLTIYAHWSPVTYIVTLNKNGGINGASSVIVKYGNAMPTVAKPTRTGYTFTGYFTAAEGGTKYYNADMSSARTWDKTVKTTLYAQWTTNTYTVILDRNGGTGGTTSVNARYTAAMPSASAPSRAGYVFAGYYDDKTAGTKYYNADMSSAHAWFKVSTGTLYAHWTAASYNVTLNKQSGSGGTSSVTATYGAMMPAANAPTRPGYVFVGYYDADSEGTKYYNADMSSARTWDKTSSATLYARWSSGSYTVTLNKQSGTGGTSTVSVKYGDAMPTATKPTRTGCTFAGYYDDKTGGTQYYTASMASARTWDKSKNVTLYARWTPNNYTVTLNRNGGSGGSASVSAIYGKAMPTASAPSRTNYNFAGYFTAKTGGTKYYNMDMSSARKYDLAKAVTLYAQWANAIVDKTEVTKKPTGLTTARNARKFTFSWKIGDDDYTSGLELQWRTNLTAAGKWDGTVSFTDKKTTSYTLTLSEENYYPATNKKLNTVSFRVRGKRAKRDVDKSESGKTLIWRYTYGWSDWVQKDYTVSAPKAPTIKQALDNEVNNASKFTWTTTFGDTDTRPYYNVEYQSILSKACNVTDGSQLTWSSKVLGWRTGAASSQTYTITITEESELLAADSYTRWVRVRSRGSAGASAWRYTKHVYARPYKPKISNTTSTVASGVTTVKVTWTATANSAHPIDNTVLQYCITVPSANQSVPSGASWTDAATYRDTAGTDAGQFSIERTVDTDEVLFVRVVVNHDRESTYSDAVLVRCGTMYAPVIDNVETVDSTRRATVEAVNNSDVPDSRLAVIYRDSDSNTQDICIGIIEHGNTSVTMLCPEWAGKEEIAFGVYAFYGTYTSSVRDTDGVEVYAVKASWKSKTVWAGGEVPVAPRAVTADRTELENEAMITWEWSWKDANRAEISWSQNPNAWESTEVPSAFVVSNLRSSYLRVSNLTMGGVWYFRVRLAKASGDDYNYGPYSDIASVDFTSAPEKPVTIVQKSIVPKGDTFTAVWTYVNADGEEQALAEIAMATTSGDTVTVGNTIAIVPNSRRATLDTSDWDLGETYYIVVRVTSASGMQSEWSDPVSITVADAVTCEITETNLTEVEIEDPDGETRTITCAESMPLSVTVSGSNTGGTTTVAIERAADYQILRPDGTEYRGYDGETVAIVTRDGPGEVLVELDDLIMQIDDGAAYRIVAIAEDRFGQTATATIDFTAMWDHQALTPQAQVNISESGVAVIETFIPDDAEDGDTYSIYRLSADIPELIVANAVPGDTYVDPYPVFADVGGYRVVYVTKYGDYIDADNRPSWIDIPREDWSLESDGAQDVNELYTNKSVIDCNGDQIILEYNLTVENAWEKDFQTTRYLGGAVRGDWNPGVQRQGTVGTVIETDNTELIQALRRFAVFSGICHVRTPDGSSYSANVNVTESQAYDKAGKLAEIALSVTRVDPDILDGVTIDQWTEEEG